MRLLLPITAILLALSVVEGMAYWWMHPAATGSGEPVLVYRPRFGGQETEVSIQGGLTAQTPSSNQKSAINNQQSSISSPTLTPLPEIYAKSAPMLRCSSGQVLHAKLDESAGIHLAFFEWDHTDTGSVLEAFRHMPEACMGSIGLKLVDHAPSRTYVVGGQGTEDRWSVVSGQLSEEESSEKSQPSSNQQSAINNHQSSITGGQGTEVSGQVSEKSQSPAPKRSTSTDNRPPTTDNSSSSTLSFDHTVFREGGGVAGLGSPIHAFRAVWVAGVSEADARKGLGGDSFDRLRTIRLKSARDRFRPAHARVIQGAVRGIPDPDLAWAAFERAMLRDLSFQ